MPATRKLQIDREAIKALAVVHGVREAARIAGLREDTVCAWSVREKWFADKPRQSLASNLQASPADLLQSVADKTKQALARAGHKAADHFDKLSGPAIVEQSGHYKNIVTAAAQLHGWDQRFAGAQFSLNVLNIGGCGIEISERRPNEQDNEAS